jgi:hypothetical protein
MTTKLLDVISKKYPLTPIDTHGMDTLKANGMTFTVSAYYAKGLGHVSLMRGKGFFGLMKMDTLIINPKEKDLPLYSYDRIFAMGNDTLIVELYDTVVNPFDLSILNTVKTPYTDISEIDLGEHWYDSIKLNESISKKGKKSSTPRLDLMATEHFNAYLELQPTTDFDKEVKKSKARAYVNGLLSNGGPPTKLFKKTLGIDKTTALFKTVLFGTEL